MREKKKKEKKIESQSGLSLGKIGLRYVTIWLIVEQSPKSTHVQAMTATT